MSNPYVCPVCNGRGVVPAGFYLSTGPSFTTGGTAQEPCRTCGGTGIVWDIPLPPLGPDTFPEFLPYTYVGRCPCLQPNEVCGTISQEEIIGAVRYRTIRCLKCNGILKQEPAFTIVMVSEDGTKKS